MKKIISRIAIVLAFAFMAVSANAQTSENPRKVWLVAHACNAHIWLKNALIDGANGVEIDVDCPKQISPTATYVDFSVAHNGYVTPEKRAEENRGIEDPDRHWVSLQEYLNFQEMDYISILWLDCKPKKPGQIYHLVKEVHRILEDRYGSKDLVPFSIIYGVYDLSTLRDAIGANYSLKYPSTPLIDWLRDNLWENEGTGLASEGEYGGAFASEETTLEKLDDFFKSHNFPVGKHFMSAGHGAWFLPPYFPLYFIELRKAKNMRDQGKYCARTGFWTAGVQGLQLFPSTQDCSESLGTECDLILMEAHNDFKPAHLFPHLFNHEAVFEYVRDFFRVDGDWYRKYNHGHYFLAGNRWEDPFYK
ncbi:MAG: hypothetical protein MJY77_07945 [Bacteroidaceae bacterium]|nr:hypothetical protein [Bacteroidaceae bacterium]